MGTQHISAEAWSAAPPSRVYELLRDGSTWTTWSPLGSYTLEREAPGGGEGVGAIRAFRTRGMLSREEAVELIPDRRFSYSYVDGTLKMRNYRADIDLQERDGGTAIHWQASFVGTIPGSGWLIRLMLGRFIQQCADGLASYAAAPHRDR